MKYNDKYFEYYQMLHDKGVPLEFTNQPFTRDDGWISAANAWLPKMEGPRHKDDYPSRFRLANIPKNAPPQGTPEYLEYWTKLYNDPMIEIGLYTTKGSILLLNGEYPPKHFLKCLAFFIVDESTNKPRDDKDIPVNIKAAAQVVSCTPPLDEIAFVNTSYSVTDSIDIQVATKDYVDEQLVKAFQVPSTMLDQTPFNEEKEPTMANEKITIEIDASCVKTTKEVKPKTAFQQKNTLLVNYYSVTGSLYANKEFSGKNALKKAKALLRAPNFAGCTMVPYTIGKMVRVKIDLEEV